MRPPRALAAALALLAAACGAEIEGAPCEVPGTTDNCPRGQGCGVDLRCSAKALGCTPCVPGASHCAAGAVETCSAAADGVCSGWGTAACGDSQACVENASGAACVCAGEPAVCGAAAGAVCDGARNVATCAPDPWGCLQVVGDQDCGDHATCTAGPAAACACLDEPACPAGTAGAVCSGDRRKVNTCETDAQGCTFLAGSLDCASTQACGVVNGVAACSCNAAPVACRGHTTPFCSTLGAGGSVTTCTRDPNQCVVFGGTTACGAHQQCDGGATCACIRDALCPAAGPRCSGDRTQVLTCATDPQSCVYLGGASTCDAAAGQMCGDAAACVPRYTVAIAAPAAGALVGPAGVAVSVHVTLATTDAALPVPPALALDDGAQPATALALKSVVGLDATYAGTYLPPAGVDQPVQLVASIAGPVALASPPVQVDVDTVAPTLSSVDASCPQSTCRRDDVLAVSVDVTDARLDSVTVTLDLDPSKVVTLSPDAQGSSRHVGTLGLKDWPFAYFAHAVTATITAHDGAGNEASVQKQVDVSRLRWTYSAGAAVTSPAVDPAMGTLFVGVAATSGQLRAIVPGDGSEKWRRTLSTTGKVKSPPAAGGTAIWVGSDDGKLYAVKVDGTGILFTCGGGVSPVSTPALRAAPEIAFAGATSQIIAAAADGTVCDRPGVPNTPNTVSSILISRRGAVLAGASTNTIGYLHRFHEDSPGLLVRDWYAKVGAPFTVPLAWSLDTRIIAAGSVTGIVYGVDSTVATASSPVPAMEVTTLPNGVVQESIVVDGATGDLLFGANDNLLHRVAVSTGADAWATARPLAATPVGVALVSKDAATGVFLTVTFADGHVAGVRDDGIAPALVWSSTDVGQLASGPLSFPVVAPPPPGAPGTQLPTLYVGSADGNLYAVVVDSPLDTTSPWPKSHHDLRNSGNASFSLP